MKLIENYANGKGFDKYFKPVIILNWYDGIITGIIELEYRTEFYLLNMCYFEPDQGLRLFFLIKVPEDWTVEVTKSIKEDQHNVILNIQEIEGKIQEYFDHFDGTVYLIKNENYNIDPDFEIAEISRKYLRYVRNIEDAISDSPLKDTVWQNFF